MSSPSLSAFITGKVATERQPPVAVVIADPAYGVVGSVVKVGGQNSYDSSELPSRTGDDAVTVAGGRALSAASGAFTTSDIGRTLTLSGPDSGSFVVSDISSSTSVLVTNSSGGSVSFVGGTGSWILEDKLSYQWRFSKIPIGSAVLQEGFRSLEEDGSLVSFSPDIVGEYEVELKVSNAVFTSDPVTSTISIRAILVPHARGIVPDGKFIWQYLRDVWQKVEGKELFETFWSALIQLVGAEMLKLYQVDFNKSIRDIQDLFQRRWLSYEPRLALDKDSLTFFLGDHEAGTGATTRGFGQDGQVSSTFALPFESGSSLDSLAPGRLLVLGDRAFTVLHSTLGEFLSQPAVIVTSDSGEVLTNLDGLFWRAPHTLISSTQNFEDLGVSAGDLLWVDVHNDNSQAVCTVPAQVVGVDRNRLGFVLTNESVSDGVVPAIPVSTYQSLATTFGISGVSVVNGALQLDKDAKKIVDTLNSAVFQRGFTNQEIDPTFSFNILNGVFHLVPSAIIRNRRLPIDPDLKSVPVLQDWIVQPTVVQEDGKIFQVRNGRKFEIPNVPYSLVENSDYMMDGKNVFSGTMIFDTGSDLLYVEGGRFTERDLRTGDVFQILEPEELVGSYYVKDAVSSDELLISSVLPDVGRVAARVQISRRKNGTFIRFVPGGFTAKNPAPNRFWAEVSFFDNGQNIENNFGILVKLKRQDLIDISSNINYRQAVAGLMFAYTKGSAIAKVRLGAQILLGLPFAEHAGIVRSIEPDYRLDHNGVPILGRILVEDTDASGVPLGVMRVYTYPTDPVSDLAGLDINPETGKVFAVGDTVDLLASLSKGVEVFDYITRPLGVTQGAVEWMQQFHTVHMRANDNIFTLDEMSLLSGFLKNITPSSVALVVSVSSEFADSISVGDFVTSGVRSDSALVDNPYFRLPTAFMFDGKSISGLSNMISELGFLWRRSSGRDLPTTNAATSVSIPLHNARVGDQVHFLAGPNQGFYTVSSISDDVLSLSGLPSLGLCGGIQDYEVVRLVQAEVRNGSFTANGTNVVTTEAGLISDGVSPGDLVITSTGLRLTLQAVSDSAMTVVGAVSAGAYSYKVIRQSLIESPSKQDWGSSTLTVSSGKYTALANPYLAALLDVGDELELSTSPFTRLSVLDPKALFFTPVLPDGTYTVHLCKRGHFPDPVTPDSLQSLGPAEEVAVSLVSATQATCTSESCNVNLGVDPTTLGVLPGDFLVLKQGGNSVDVGYGQGVYPIVGLSSSVVTLAAALSSSDSSTWNIMRRR